MNMKLDFFGDFVSCFLLFYFKNKLKKLSPFLAHSKSIPESQESFYN